MNSIILLFFLVFSPVVTFQDEGFADVEVYALQKGPESGEEEKVRQLILYVRNLNGAVFIRNGKEYSPEKAADHLQSKWNKHKKKVKTASDFVERLATESRSNEAYEIRYEDGTSIKLRDLLRQELAKLEN